MDLFVYGTLLFSDVLAALLHRVPAGRSARATGWRVAALPKRLYPGLVPHPGSIAGGLVLCGLDDAEARLLDAYEAAEYERTTITLDDGSGCAAYVWRTAALPHDWSQQRFAAEHLAEYVRHCTRWRAAAGSPGRPEPPGTSR